MCNLRKGFSIGKAKFVFQKDLSWPLGPTSNHSLGKVYCLRKSLTVINYLKQKMKARL